jgi:hypothetical protein
VLKKQALAPQQDRQRAMVEARPDQTPAELAHMENVQFKIVAQPVFALASATASEIT